MAMPIVAHGPSDEDGRYTRLEDDGGESCAFLEGAVTHIVKSIREGDGGETTAVSEGVVAKACEGARKCKRGEPTTTIEC